MTELSIFWDAFHDEWFVDTSEEEYVRLRDRLRELAESGITTVQITVLTEAQS